MQVNSEVVRNPLGSSLHRIPCKMGVAGGGLKLTVTEELADHRQAFAQRESPGRVAVPQDAAPRARDCEGTDEAGVAMTKLKDQKNRFIEDPEFRGEYARVDEEYALVEAQVRACTPAKLDGGTCPGARHDPVGGRAA